ncbi:MAG: hypothetical protein JSS62_01050 [Verrucomicrobia bacterium]|nr:hypothetical protein [Verrucomicrobiota bacterium]MBS0646056.1 hypothetical protein [Verrucomicrobiota bacterium]
MANTRRTEARICPNWLERGCRAAECKRSNGGAIALITAVVLAVLGTLALIYSQGSTDLSSVSGIITLAAGGGLLVALAFFLAAGITLSKPKSREQAITLETPVQRIQEPDLQSKRGYCVGVSLSVTIDSQQSLKFNFSASDLLYQMLMQKLRASETESQISISSQDERVTRAEFVKFVNKNKANFLSLCQDLRLMVHITNAQLEEKIHWFLNRFSFSNHKKNCFQMWLLMVLRELAS